MTSKLYCVYLTTYIGNKLPMFYIGHTSVENINNGYRGSVASRRYHKIWRQELFNNPHLFKTKILCTFDTKKEAAQKESSLQQKLNVVPHPMYINMTDGTTPVWKYANTERDHYLKNTKRYINTITGKLVCLTPDNVKPHHVIDTSKQGMVAAFNTKTKSTEYVPSDEFVLNRDLVGVVHGKCTVTVKSTGQKIRITTNEYDRNIYLHTTTNMVCVFDVVDGIAKHVDKEEYRANRSRYIHSSENKTVVLDMKTGKFCSIATSKYHKNTERYINGSAAYIQYKNIETNDIVKLLVTDTETLNSIIISGKYERLLKTTSNGKLWYSNLETNECNFFFEGTEPAGWVKKRIYNRTIECVWFCNIDRTQEKYCTVEDCPEGWIRGRQKRTRVRKKADPMMWIHDPLTGTKRKVLEADNIPEGWLRGTGYKMSDEDKAKRSVASSGRIWIYDPITEKERMIKPTEEIPEGWIKGSLSIQRRRSPIDGKFMSTA